jgi:hypothetical protein
MLDYHPLPGETIGRYLRRLREAAGQVNGRPVRLETVVALTEELPQPQRLTIPWLSKVETDEVGQPGGDKLRTVAAAYSHLLKKTIQPEWLLKLCGYEVGEAIDEQPTTERESTWVTLFENSDVLTFLDAARQLLEIGHPEDVAWAATTAKRLLEAHAPERKAGNILDNAALSARLKQFLKDAGL